MVILPAVDTRTQAMWIRTSGIRSAQTPRVRNLPAVRAGVTWRIREGRRVRRAGRTGAQIINTAPETAGRTGTTTGRTTVQITRRVQKPQRMRAGVTTTGKREDCTCAEGADITVYDIRTIF